MQAHFSENRFFLDEILSLCYAQKKGGRNAMKYETTEQAVKAFKKLQQVMAAYHHVLGVTYLDAATSAPKGTYEGRGQTMAIMSEITYDLTANEKNGALLEALEKDSESLDPQTRREVEVFRKNYDRIHRIPQEEYVAYSVLQNDAEAIWEKAKNENDFAAFAL